MASDVWRLLPRVGRLASYLRIMQTLEATLGLECADTRGPRHCLLTELFWFGPCLHITCGPVLVWNSHGVCASLNTSQWVASGRHGAMGAAEVRLCFVCLDVLHILADYLLSPCALTTLPCFRRLRSRVLWDGPDCPYFGSP